MALYITGTTVYAGRPPTYYFSRERYYLGIVVDYVLSRRRKGAQYVIKFDMPDATGDTDPVAVPFRNKHGKQLIRRQLLSLRQYCGLH